MNPVGAEDGMRIYEKINNNSLSWEVKKPRGLGTTGCSWCDYANLKSSAITELSELSNTMNMVMVLQGKDPPPLIDVLNYIWKP